MPIIVDGVINYEVLREINKNKNWIMKLLQEKNLNLSDIFYAFYTKNKTFIIRRCDLI